LASVAALVVAAGTIVLGNTSSQAVGAAGVPYRPDPHSKGSLTFYNSAGTKITGGALTTHPFVNYSIASGNGNPGDGLAQLYVYTPQEHVDPLNWSGDSMSGTNAYPVTGSGVPAVIKSSGKPTTVAGASDFSLHDYITEFPNNLTGDYAGLYEVRLVTGKAGSGINTASYFSADVKVTGANWAVVAASGTATATALAITPKTQVTIGSSITLRATVTPKIAGSVEFFDGATSLGTVPVSATTGIATKATTPATVGTHTYNATFTPTDTGTFNGSTSPVVAYLVQPRATKVTVSASPASPRPPGTSVTFIATVTPPAAGGIKFLDGLTVVGSPAYNAVTGKATLTLMPALGDHAYTAQFTSTDPKFDNSQSTAFKYGIKVPSTIKAKLSPTKTTYGHSAKATVTVVASGQKPTGQVSVKDGSKLVGSGLLKSGKATIKLSKTITVKTHTLTFTYLGDGKVGASHTTAKLTVVKASTKASAKVSPTHIKTTGKAMLSVTVSAFGVKPTGRVTIKDGSKALKVLTLKSGNVKFVLSKLKKGTHHITVTYAGTANFATSKSKAVTLTVTK
jgi:Bacterial Ig-like domain (group 3)